MFRKLNDSLKSGFGRVRGIVQQGIKSGIENFPKAIQKTIETSRKVRDGANTVKGVADKVGSVLKSSPSIDGKTKSSLDKGFNFINKNVDRINKTDKLISDVGSAIMS